jgi:hypothetical protein
VRFDEDVRRRVRRDGRDATVQRLCDAYRAFRDAASAQNDVPMPAEPDFARGAVALDLLEKQGLRRTARFVRQWAEREARRADRATAPAVAMPMAARQKPGDDFGGYPIPPDGGGFTCDDMTIVVDLIVAAMSIFAITGNEAMALALGAIGAFVALAKDMACIPRAT